MTPPTSPSTSTNLVFVLFNVRICSVNWILIWHKGSWKLLYISFSLILGSIKVPSYLKYVWVWIFLKSSKPMKSISVSIWTIWKYAAIFWYKFLYTGEDNSFPLTW